MRHISLRDLLAELLKDIYKDVVIEPALLVITGETWPCHLVQTSVMVQD